MNAAFENRRQEYGYHVYIITYVLNLARCRKCHKRLDFVDGVSLYSDKVNERSKKTPTPVAKALHSCKEGKRMRDNAREITQQVRYWLPECELTH